MHPSSKDQQSQHHVDSVDQYLRQVSRKYSGKLIEPWTPEDIQLFTKQLQNLDYPTDTQHSNHCEQQMQPNTTKLVRAGRKHFGGYCVVCKSPLGEEGTEMWEWCRMCGQQCCAHCVGRYRILANDQKLATGIDPEAVCEACDAKLLAALLQKHEQDQMRIARKALLRMQQQIAELPNHINQKDMIPVSEVQLKKAASSLKSINASLSMQNLQIRRKITWGEDIKSKLEARYKKVRKHVSKSMTDTSIVDEDSMSVSSNIRPARVCAQSEVSRTESENINESTLQSVIEDESQMIGYGQGRCCVACAIM